MGFYLLFFYYSYWSNYGNQKYKIIKEKYVWKKEKVTCKNCLKILSKNPTYRQLRRFRVIDTNLEVK